MSYNPVTPVSVPDAAWGQQINDNMSYLFEDRSALVGFVETQDVLTDTPTTLTDSEIEATEDGLYLVTAHVGSTAGTGGTRRYVRLIRNGTDDVAIRQGSASLNGTFHSAVTTLVQLAAGDTLSIDVVHEASTTLTYYGRLTALLVAP